MSLPTPVMLLTPLAGAVFSKDDVPKIADAMGMPTDAILNIINASCQSSGHYLTNSRIHCALISVIVATKHLSDKNMRDGIIAKTTPLPQTNVWEERARQRLKQQNQQQHQPQRRQPQPQRGGPQQQQQQQQNITTQNRYQTFQNANPYIPQIKNPNISRKNEDVDNISELFQVMGELRSLLNVQEAIRAMRDLTEALHNAHNPQKKLFAILAFSQKAEYYNL